MNTSTTANIQNNNPTAYYHLPGLFEFYELYRIFLPLFREHREYFYDWCEIGSIYGTPSDCIWGGGRTSFGYSDPEDVLDLMWEHGISARLTFSNSLLREEHLTDKKCNDLCKMFECSHSSQSGSSTILQSCPKRKESFKESDTSTFSDTYPIQNGVIVHSDLLSGYLQKNYPDLYLVSSTTKVLTDFQDFLSEINREEFRYVVPDFRLNKQFAKLDLMSLHQKDKVEFLCNECCWFGCKDRKTCYESVSRKNLGEPAPEFHCASPNGNDGYRFSKAMENPGFISVDDIQNIYMPMGFSNFKIEGRGLGSALILEFLLYYMTKPKYQLRVREEIYLDNMLDLF